MGNIIKYKKMGHLKLRLRSASLESTQTNEKSKIGELVKAGINRDGLVDSPGQEKSSGVSSYNSEAGSAPVSRFDQAQMNQILNRMAKIEEENQKLKKKKKKKKKVLCVD